MCGLLLPTFLPPPYESATYASDEGLSVVSLADELEYDKICTLVDGTTETYPTLSTLNGNVLTSTAQTGFAGVTLTAGEFSKETIWKIPCLKIKPSAPKTAEKVVITAPKGYTIVGYEIECFSYSPAYCPYYIDTNETYTGTSLGGSQTTFTVSDLETNSTHFWIYANAETLANYFCVSSFKVYLKHNALPKDGKIYNINFISKDQNKFWGLTANETKVKGVENTTGSDFVAHKYTNADGNVRFIFVNNADGYYLAYQSVNETFNVDYAINEFAVDLLSGYSDSNVTATDEQKEGKVYITNDRRYDNNTDQTGCYILKEENGALDNSKTPYYNGTFTSALTFDGVDTEVSDAAALAIQRFDAIYAAKPYKDVFGNGFGQASAILNGNTYYNFNEYVNAVNSATQIESYSVEFKEPKDNRVYKIYSYQNGGTLYQIANNEAVINPADVSIDNNYGYWVCHKDGDNYTFSSAAGDGTYLGWRNLSNAPYNFNLLTDAKNAGCYSFYSAANSTGGGRYLYVHNDYRWNQNGSAACAAGGSTDFMLEEVDASVYTASISGTANGQLIYNGEGYIGNAAVLNGGTWVLNNSVTAADFTAATVDGYKASEVTLDGTTVSVQYSLDIDLIISESLDNAKWLRIGNCSNSNYFMYATADGSTLGTQSKNIASEEQLIAFVGSDESFKIYSRAKGADYALTAANTNSGTAATWTAADEAATWKLIKTYAGDATNPRLGITLSDADNNMSLNMFGGNGGDCKFYNCGANNLGSHWTYEIIVQDAEVSISLDKATRYPETNYIWGHVNYTVSGANPFNATITNISEANNAKLFLTDGYSISNISAEAYCGYDVSVNGTDIVFSGNDEEYQNLAYSPKDGHPYRIPAIAKAANGNLVAIFDYRPCNNDVGYGEVDQVMRISKDNGRTWSEIETIADGDGSLNDNVFGLAYGDPALVADRESNKMVLITVSGRVVYSSANATNRPFIARLTSNDGGETWSDPEDITSQFWGETGAIFQNGDEEASASVFAYSGFFGSGKILQGSFRAEGAEYNRLYAAMLVRGKGLQGAYVVYSDDFGETWKLLGGDAGVKALSQSNEPKVEELPDGNILLSGRLNGGRCFNIFTYTDKENATGTWGTGGNLTLGINNSTNGEVLVVDAVKAEDNSAAKIMLLSVPLGPNRANIGVYYKDITNENDYNNVNTFTNAANWTLGRQISNGDAAYSTMCVQQDGRIGLLYEGTPTSHNGYGYSIIYVNTNIEELTNNAYTTPSNLKTSYDDATGTITLTGTAANTDAVVDAISGVTGNTTITSVDLTGTWLQPSIAEVHDAVVGVDNVSKNSIIYLPGLTDVSDEINNVVVDGLCQNLVLTDKADFAPISGFTAVNAVYSKSELDTEGWYSCVLPYSFNIPEDIMVLSNASVDGNVINFSEINDIVEANTPFLYKSNANEISFVANNVKIADEKNLESGELLGTYRLIPAGETTGKLILNSTGSAFATATETASIPAFRAFINEQTTGANSYVIVIDDITGINNIGADDANSPKIVNIYSIDGKLLRKGVNIHNALDEMENGIYIINNKKIKK